MSGPDARTEEIIERLVLATEYTNTLVVVRNAISELRRLSNENATLREKVAGLEAAARSLTGALRKGR